MSMISVRGRRLEYEAVPAVLDKSLLTVLFVHGSGGDREDWRGQLDGHSMQTARIALELPGHGKSQPPGETTVPAYSQWVADFVEALKLERVMLVGHSLGSAITQWIALSPPPWLVAIGLVGGGARLRVHPALLEGLIQNKDQALGMLADWALSSSPDKTLLAQLRQKFLGTSAELVHGDLSACNEFDVMDRIGSVRVPTWIAVGDGDRLTPPKYSAYLHGAIQGSTLAVIPEAGHLVMVEQSEEFNRRLEEFVTAL